jgi:acetyl esterase/lipase
MAIRPDPTPYVDSQNAAFLRTVSTILDGKQLGDVSISQARNLFRELQTPAPQNSSVTVSHHEVATSHGNVRTSIYRPKDTSGSHHLPVIFHVHGGGWILGNIFDFEPFVFDLVERTECVVVFPRYTLAPDAKFPVQQEQCLDVLQYIVDHGDELMLQTDKVAISADSAGGELRFVVVLSVSSLSHIPLPGQIATALLSIPIPGRTFPYQQVHRRSCHELLRQSFRRCLGHYSFARSDDTRASQAVYAADYSDNVTGRLAARSRTGLCEAFADFWGYLWCH